MPGCCVAQIILNTTQTGRDECMEGGGTDVFAGDRFELQRERHPRSGAREALRAKCRSSCLGAASGATLKA